MWMRVFCWRRFICASAILHWHKSRPWRSLKCDREIYLGEDQEEKVIARYEDLLEVNPNQAQPDMLLAIIYEKQKRYDKSEAHYRSALEVNPGFAATANNLAFYLANQNKEIDEALRLLFLFIVTH